MFFLNTWYLKRMYSVCIMKKCQFLDKKRSNEFIQFYSVNENRKLYCITFSGQQTFNADNTHDLIFTKVFLVYIRWTGCKGTLGDGLLGLGVSLSSRHTKRWACVLVRCNVYNSLQTKSKPY